ncbi:MAG: GNAT family N-acetyltransferase, partial [candidate division Zixibacteria bacterium]|nr:GNAT family N-acetyltransferase [candidate division Zixibacteria bacterium]
MSLEYRRATVSFEQVHDLQKRNGLDASTTAAWHEWVFQNNPYGPAGFYCAFDGNRLVGTQVLLPLELQLQGRTVLSSLSNSSLIDLNYRGQGMWKQLLLLCEEGARRDGSVCIWGAPNEASMPILRDRMGWEFVAD